MVLQHRSGYHQDNRSTQRLLQRALSCYGGTEYLDTVQRLRYRGTSEVFDAARALVCSTDAAARSLGADILAQPRIPQVFPLEESWCLLLGLLRDSDPRVLRSAAEAVAPYALESAIEPLLTMKSHSESAVRAAAAYGLSFLQHNDMAWQALIELASDPSTIVKREASEALAYSGCANQSITKILLELAGDSSADVRGHALLGLALRGHSSVAKLILRELSRDEFSDDVLDAAGETGDPLLLPALLDLRLHGVESVLLDQAILKQQVPLGEKDQPAPDRDN